MEAALQNHPDEPGRVRGARADLLGSGAWSEGGPAAPRRADEVPGCHDDPVRARRGLRQAEELRRGGSRVPPGARARAGTRRRAQLPWLHARRARRTARRIGRLPEEGRRDGTGERLVSRQPRMGVLQGRQVRSRRGEPEARRRSADAPIRSSRNTTASCSSESDGSKRRSPPGTARSKATAARSTAPTSTARSRTPDKKSRNDADARRPSRLPRLRPRRPARCR